jgi:hypothetical protein
VLRKPYSDQAIRWMVVVLATQVLVAVAVALLLPLHDLIFIDGALTYACIALLLAKSPSLQWSYSCMALGLLLLGLGGVASAGALHVTGAVISLVSCVFIILSILKFPPSQGKRV